MISTLFFGSIGVLAETSDIQRRAYNQALDESTLDWHWNEDTYRRLLTMAGGKRRLRLLADATETKLTDAEIDEIHARKTELACAEVRNGGVTLRPGVAETITLARDNGISLGLVTSTYPANIEAIADAAGADLPLDAFDAVISTEDIERGKPAPDAYREALRRCGAEPASTLAIEDTAVSVLAAAGAGLRAVATPGALTDDQIIVGAELVLAGGLAGPDGGVHADLRALITG